VSGTVAVRARSGKRLKMLTANSADRSCHSRESFSRLAPLVDSSLLPLEHFASAAFSHVLYVSHLSTMPTRSRGSAIVAALCKKLHVDNNYEFILEEHHALDRCNT
jgi:hypothetical protein